MTRKSSLFIAIGLLVICGTGAAQQDADREAEIQKKLAAPNPLGSHTVFSVGLDGLPGGAGREEVYGLCGACHSLMIVKQQGLSRAAWEETMEWMVEEQGMPELDRETLDLVIDYLAEHYGIGSRGTTARP